jgi:hypothetical protein
MKKKNQKKQQKKKKNNKISFLLLAGILTAIVLIWIIYPIFSNWKNTLYIPDIPDIEGQPKVFENYIKKMRAAAIENPESARALGRLGMTFHANVFYKEAERCYIRAMNLNPQEWRWPYYQALINEELGDIQNAVAN